MHIVRSGSGSLGLRLRGLRFQYLLDEVTRLCIAVRHVYVHAQLVAMRSRGPHSYPYQAIAVEVDLGALLRAHLHPEPTFSKILLGGLKDLGPLQMRMCLVSQPSGASYIFSSEPTSRHVPLLPPSLCTSLMLLMRAPRSTALSMS